MEVHFPHITNGIAKAMPTRRQRARSIRKMLLTAGVCGTLALSVNFAFASTMNQEMIAEEEKIRAEVCYKLQVRINNLMYNQLVVRSDTAMSTSGAEYLELLTSSYGNYCKR